MLALHAQCQTVALQGTLGSKALLIVGGGAPQVMAPGDTRDGIKLISVDSAGAVVEAGGQRLTLRVGEVPASVGERRSALPRSTRVVLQASGNGHFIGSGAINGRPVQFMVDTGASFIALSAQEAERLGLPWRSGRPMAMGTANGTTVAFGLKLDSVSLGDVVLHDIAAVVTPQPMPYVLLGNSFLSRMRMRRDDDQMVLEQRF